MSFKIDFDELPYDLFTLLKLNQDCTTRDVKKAYKRAIKLYHPDKNPNIDDEYFSWISLAHKILSNPEHKELYIEWKEWKDEHSRLKNNREEIKIESTKTFKELEEELNRKHGFIPDDKTLSNSEMKNLISKVKFERENLKINYEPITDINKSVDELKKNQEKLVNKNQDIIEYSGNLTTLQSFSEPKYGSLDNYGQLYSENENVANNNITSLNQAFNLSHYQQYIPDNLTLEQKMKMYDKETNNLKNIKHVKKDYFD